MTIFESTLSTETRNFPTLKQQKIRASPWKPASISHVWRKLGSQRLLSHVLSHLRPIVSTPNYIDVQERPSGLFMGKFVFPATFGRERLFLKGSGKFDGGSRALLILSYILPYPKIMKTENTLAGPLSQQLLLVQ